MDMLPVPDVEPPWQESKEATFVPAISLEELVAL